jgi:hypothetical protein
MSYIGLPDKNDWTQASLAAIKLKDRGETYAAGTKCPYQPKCSQAAKRPAKRRGKCFTGWRTCP